MSTLSCEFCDKTFTNKTVLKTHMLIDESTGHAMPVTGTTRLDKLMGKVIIVIDKFYAPTYKAVSSLGKYVNMECSSDSMYTYGYSILLSEQHNTPFIKNDGINTNVQVMKLVYPDTTYGIMGWSSNPIYYPVVLNYGVQVALYPYYAVDMYLGKYDAAFAANKTAFVPMSKMITYLKGSLELGSSPSASGSPA